MRDSFVFYLSFAQAASTLGDKARLKLYDSVIKLGLSCAENVTELEQVCSEIETSLVQNRNAFAQFLLIKPQIIANFTRYRNGSKGAKYGTLGGAPKGNKNAAKNNPKTTPNENVNENVNEKEKEKKEKKFLKPTFDEVEAYCKERGNGVDADRFISYYEANGWKVGRNPMKDWRAAVRTWERGSESVRPAVTVAANDGWTAEDEQRHQKMMSVVEATKRMLAEQTRARFGV